MTHLPTVTALCITGKSDFHVSKLLPVALDCLVNQTYPKHLIDLVLCTDAPGLRISVPSGLDSQVVFATGSLGRLRNASLTHAKGDVTIQWDDDDWHHPDRIRQHVDAYIASGGCPVFLRRQLCYSFLDDSAYVRQFDHTPIQGTILAPRSDIRYPDLAAAEDSDYYGQWLRAGRIAVLDNEPGLYVRLAHGHNTWDHGHIMREHDGKRGQWAISDSDVSLLRDVLSCYHVL